jgi:hypothetical protein
MFSAPAVASIDVRIFASGFVRSCCRGELVSCMGSTSPVQPTSVWDQLDCSEAIYANESNKAEDPGRGFNSYKMELAMSHYKFHLQRSEHTQSRPGWKYSLYGIQNVALMIRPVRLRLGYCFWRSACCMVSTSFKLSRRSNSLLDFACLAACDGS